MHTHQLERSLHIPDPELPWDPTQPKAGEALLRQMTKNADVLTQIARAQGLQGKLNDAELTLDEAQKMLGSAVEVASNIRLLLERGRLLALRKTPIQARERFIEVWSRANEAGLH